MREPSIRCRRGVTGLEMLVAVILIAVLLVVVGARYRQAKRAAYQTQMKAETRDLIAAQEAFYQAASLTRTGARYAESPEQLAFVPHQTVVIEMRGGRKGWAALVTSRELPPDDYYCWVHAGQVEPYRSDDRDGVMSCEPEG